MFDFLRLPERHGIAMLKRDHDKVKALFDEFEQTHGRARKEKIIAEALTELKIHAVLQEEIFYPAIRSHVGDELMNEAGEEHHVAKILIAELEAGGADSEHRDAKFTVLAKSVRHHIKKKEESEILPKAQEMELDFEALGDKMQARKEDLLENGIPSDAEHAMVPRTRRKTTSSKSAAPRKRAPARRKTTVKAKAKSKPTRR